MKRIEIIVPVFNEEESLPSFYEVVSKVLDTIEGYSYSFIFVNDGSSDRSLKVMKALAAEDDRVKYISFSRNFGKEAAIYAGLSNSTADLTVLLDADLQHPPALIPDMVSAIDSGEWDACGAKRKPGLMSRAFTSLNNKMSPVKLQSGATDFMCMNRKFVDAVLELSENQRFSKGLFAWVGFRVKWFDYIQEPRTLGKSKWNFRKLFSYAIDGITGFSIMPLEIVGIVGTIVFGLSLVYILAVLVRTIICGIDVPGYVTTLVAVLFFGGIILMSVGILGIYIGKIFMESKNRPLYIAEQTNLKKTRDYSFLRTGRKPQFVTEQTNMKKEPDRSPSQTGRRTQPAAEQTNRKQSSPPFWRSNLETIQPGEVKKQASTRRSDRENQ